jgi:hypothetical protein
LLQVDLMAGHTQAGPSRPASSRIRPQ